MTERCEDCHMIKPLTQCACGQALCSACRQDHEELGCNYDDGYSEPEEPEPCRQ